VGGLTATSRLEPLKPPNGLPTVLRTCLIAGVAVALGLGAESGVALARDCDVRGTSDGERLVGTPDRDVICGLGGRDRIFGMGGNDVIVGGRGPDRVYGGKGSDLPHRR
jgi:hypothetical protein